MQHLAKDVDRDLAPMVASEEDGTARLSTDHCTQASFHTSSDMDDAGDYCLSSLELRASKFGAIVLFCLLSIGLC